MIYINIFLLLNLALSIYLILQHRLLNAIIAEGIISSLSAALFFLLKAPDIAITQIAIGSGFLTFLFIVSIKIKEKIIVAYCEESTLIYSTNDKHYGIAVEVLENFAEKEGIDIEYKHIDKDTLQLLKDGEIDVYVTLEKIETKLPKIKYFQTQEVILKRETGSKSTASYKITKLLENLGNPSIKEILTTLPSLIYVRNKLQNFKIEKSSNTVDIYFYLNPYNSDLIGFMKKYVDKNSKFIKDLVEKYV